jgi:hypothetical protein
MHAHHCKRCGQTSEKIGSPVELSHGASIQWIKCTACNLYDGVLSIDPGQPNSPVTLNEIASALKIKIDFPKYIGE